jgi:hypothetical protein
MGAMKHVATRTTRARQRGESIENVARLDKHWRRYFLTSLAETSNVRLACAAAGVPPSTVYDLRRRDADFAAKWAEALCEGYDNLEMEMLYRLRSGERADDPKFNYPIAFRMLQQHREAVTHEKARRANVTARSVRASLDRKVAEMRALILARKLLGEGPDGHGGTARDGAD